MSTTRHPNRAGTPRPLVRSPLLIPRGARSGGGVAGRRVELFAAGGGYRVQVRGDVSRDAQADDAFAAVQQFNHALREAARAGLTSVPEPAELTLTALHAVLDG